MAKAPWTEVAEVLAGGGLQAAGRAAYAAAGQETVRQVVFGMFPALPLGEKNYLVGLVGSFLRAGEEQQGALFGLPIPQADIPVNPGLGGTTAATDRYRYSTYVGVADPSGRTTGSLAVDVYSPVELSDAAIAQAAEAQLQQWSGQSPTLAKYLSAHPVPTGVTVIGVQRAY